MSDKLLESHRSRTALVYVRQSSPTQVRHNLESQRRQYGLSDRAKELGFNDIRVIDEDLGRSGSGQHERPGFATMVALLCEGKVGAVFVIEASRIARNGRDWHHIIELCALTATVLVDHDGVYDPRQLNDRMLLGLKGAMAEFELGLIMQRSREALKGMLKRGAVMWRPPVGYVRERHNRLVKTPDLQVQQAIETVFAKFFELGTARQVVLWFRDHGLELPATVKGTDGTEVRWWAARHDIILGILKNPFYAGSFVWPQRKALTYVLDGRARTKPGRRLPAEQWQVVLHDRHPAYITWEQFDRTQRQLMDNQAKRPEGRRAATSGSALFVGLLRCGHCGRKLQIIYLEKTARYFCPGRQDLVRGCLAFGNYRFDTTVAGAVVTALNPLGIEASLRAWRELKLEHDAQTEALRLALQKADYEVRLAQRRYEAIDPDNRLVATELERRWNDALTAQNGARQRLDEALAGAGEELTHDDEQRLRALGEDMPRLWDHPDADITLKKRVLRAALEEIIVTVDAPASELVLVIRWAGGAHTTMRTHKHRSGRNRRAIEPAALERLRELALICDDTAIARILNMNGIRTGPGNPWTEPRVRAYRSRNGIPAFDPDRARSWLTMVEAARTKGVSPSTIRALINEAVLEARQLVPNAPWQIERSALEQPPVARRLAQVTARDRSRRETIQGDLFVKSTTYDEGVS